MGGNRKIFEIAVITALLKHKLYKQHVADRAGCNGQEHVLFQTMYDDDKYKGNHLGKTVALAEKGHVFKAVDCEHAKGSGGENFPKRLHKFGCGLFPTENKKRQKTGSHCAEDNHEYGYDLLCQSHLASPALSIGLRRIVSIAKIKIMAGIKKSELPNSTRQRMVQKTPINELRCCFSFIH